jgi:chromosomal replication initiation ATPase DnaA
MHKFKIGSQYKDEWSMLQCHVDEFSKMHMNDSSIDIPLPVAMNDLNNRSQCFISTNIEGIKPYDLSIEKEEQRYRKKYGNEIAHNCPDKIVSNNEFASLVQQLNNEQRIILDNVLYKKRKNPRKSLFIFIIGGVGTGKTFPFFALSNIYYDIIIKSIWKLIRWNKKL